MARRSIAPAKAYNRIAVLRADRAISRRQLAEAIGVNYQTIGYLERGENRPSLDLAFRIADHFELPLEAVFSRKPIAPTSAEREAKMADVQSTAEERLAP